MGVTLVTLYNHKKLVSPKIMHQTSLDIGPRAQSDWDQSLSIFEDAVT